MMRPASEYAALMRALEKSVTSQRCSRKSTTCVSRPLPAARVSLATSQLFKTSELNETTPFVAVSSFHRVIEH